MTSRTLFFGRQTLVALTLGTLSGLGCTGEVGDFEEITDGEQQALSCAQSVTRETRVESGRWMTSTVNYDGPTGIARVETVVSNSRSVWGWTGGVALIFVDQNLTPLYVTDVRTRGVDACLFRCPRTSTLNWTDIVPFDVRDRVAGVAIAHAHTNTSRAALGVLKAITIAAPNCAFAPPPWNALCAGFAATAKLASDELDDMTQELYEDTVKSMQRDIVDNLSMFPPCPGGPAGSNLVPTMTGPNSPSGSVTRSGVYSGTYEGWKAFDADANSMWISEVFVTPATLGYRWADGPRTVRRYALSFVNGSLTSRAPKDWTLEGSNGSSWVVLDQRSNQTAWAGKERREYSVANPGSYSEYRLKFTDDNDTRSGVVVISLGGVEFMN